MFRLIPTNYWNLKVDIECGSYKYKKEENAVFIRHLNHDQQGSIPN